MVLAFKQIEERINQIGLLVDEEIDPPENPEEVLQQIEKAYQMNLPADYRKFLMQYGGRMTDASVFFTLLEKSPSTPEDGKEIMGFFYGLQDAPNSLRNNIDAYIGRMPSWLIPIGELPGGDQLCIGIEGENCGKIYIWDHENELVAKQMIDVPVKCNDVDEYSENLYLVANSFLDFIFCFRRED